MATSKYLLLYRGPAAGADFQPSPQEYQQLLAQWQAWKEKFKTEVIDIGDGLKGGGKVVKAGAVTDGPFIEAKEVMGGYSIVETSSLERAVVIAQACPVLFGPGASIEVRELAGF